VVQLRERQLNHTAWRAQEGAPQGITALAHAPDGTLWIGTIGGLYRFDGHAFISVQSPPGDPEMPAEMVGSLLVTRDGTVWAGYYRSGVMRIAAGRVTRFDDVGGRRIQIAQGFSEARDGSVWAYGDAAIVMRFPRGGSAWLPEARPPEGAGAYIDALYVDRSDVLWLAQNGRMFRRQLPEKTYRMADVGADWVQAITETPTGDVWMADYVRKAGRAPAALRSIRTTARHADPPPAGSRPPLHAGWLACGCTGRRQALPVPRGPPDWANEPSDRPRD
jgi:ligand-binding sensor domain-containing protein